MAQLLLSMFLASFTVYSKVSEKWTRINDAKDIAEYIRDGKGCAWLKDSITVAQGQEIAQNMKKKFGANWTFTPARPETGDDAGSNARISVELDATPLDSILGV